MERQGVESHSCSARLFQENIPSEKHHFLVINDNDQMFVYDPFNVKSTGMPRVMNTKISKSEFMQKLNGKETFVLEFEADVKELKSKLDIGDLLGYGIRHCDR